jgi:predicted Fe-S protein YdhL (DUF1289 family)
MLKKSKNKPQSIQVVDTPCVGICSTVYGDDVCRGCKRQFIEVTNWNGYELSEKKSVLQRLAKDIDNILSPYVVVHDVKCIQEELLALGGRLIVNDSPLTQLWRLLVAMLQYKLSDEQVNDFCESYKRIKRYGFDFKDDLNICSLDQWYELWRELDKKWYNTALNVNDSYISEDNL